MAAQNDSETPASPDLLARYDEKKPLAAHSSGREAVHAHASKLEIKPIHAPPISAEPAHPEALHPEATELTSFVADLEASLGDSFPQAEPPAPRPSSTSTPDGKPLAGWPVAPAPKRAVTPAPAAARTPRPEPAIAASAASASTAAAAAPAPAMSYSPSAVRSLGAGAQAMHPSDSVDLSEMFGELKLELEEDFAAGDDDPETHYNLGVAFREMGLLDEAIAELQKVCNSIERGIPFSQPIQTYTWLAQCFLDKGVPDAAIRWYEKALAIPGLDAEARLAINYELGSACETAQDKPAALRHFTCVYGANIDYRDVAERIQALKS